mmetsp:Transcript_7152/g.24386  ORF Transcript_7152/g.24386 Transcript_7152/m.24386 type:complete len:229 (+) Transcript_7152:364-1050(+)
MLEGLLVVGLHDDRDAAREDRLEDPLSPAPAGGCKAEDGPRHVRVERLTALVANDPALALVVVPVHRLPHALGVDRVVEDDFAPEIEVAPWAGGGLGGLGVRGGHGPRARIGVLGTRGAQHLLRRGSRRDDQVVVWPSGCTSPLQDEFDPGEGLWQDAVVHEAVGRVRAEGAVPHVASDHHHVVTPVLPRVERVAPVHVLHRGGECAPALGRDHPRAPARRVGAEGPV